MIALFAKRVTLIILNDTVSKMATNLVVRNIDESIVLALKQRGAANGRSAEAEHREILKSALKRPNRQSLAQVLSSMPNVGEDADIDFRNERK